MFFFTGDSSNRASELATNFLSTLRIEPDAFVKSETPETVGDTKGMIAN